MPGVNGSGSFSWYPPLVCSRSANDTPAAATSMTTLPSAAGSSTSAQRTSSCPVNPAIRCANIRTSFRRLPPAVPDLPGPGLPQRWSIAVAITTTMDHRCGYQNLGSGQASPAGIQAARIARVVWGW